jgi:hypothetical protein
MSQQPIQSLCKDILEELWKNFVGVPVRKEEIPKKEEILTFLVILGLGDKLGKKVKIGLNVLRVH